MARLDLPQWPRDAAFIRRVEKMMPVKFVGLRYGSPARWRRQLQTIRNLVTLPPDQWGGLSLRWDLPSYLPAYNMECTGCCDQGGCCCTIPTTLNVDVTIPAGSECESCGECPPGPIVGFEIDSSSAPIVCDTEDPDHFNFEGFAAGPCDEADGCAGCIMCQMRSLTVECTDGTYEISEDNVTADGDPTCGGALALLTEASCEPTFELTGNWVVSAHDVECICGNLPAGDETWTVRVYE